MLLIGVVVVSVLELQSVATPSILRDDNYTKAEFGAVVTASYAGNMASKFITGPFIDKVGGKALLLTGGVGSVACAILFVSLSLTGIPGLSVAAALNRVNQALGWGAVLKVISKWFDGKHRARATGLASAGYFLSDAVARLALGGVLSLSQGIPGAEMNWTRPWQIMYYASAGAGLVLLLPVIFGVRESPENLGEVEAEQGEGTLYDDEPAFSDAPVVGGTESLTSSSSQTTLSSPDADASTESAKVPSDSEKQHLITPSSPLRTGKSDEVAKPVAAAPPRGGWKQDLIVLLRSPRYLLLLVQSVCLSLVREVFNSWTPVFFSGSSRPIFFFFFLALI
jgi:sugar phosphate permease